MYAPNITRAELLHSDTAKRLKISNEPTPEHEENLVRLSWFLQSLRDKISIRFPNRKVYLFISSGYRSPALNSAVRGSRTSAHMRGLAADITCNVLTPYQLAQFVAEQMAEEGFDQVIQEFNRWVHVGLAEKSAQRYETLTAYRKNGSTKYKPGIHRD